MTTVRAILEDESPKDFFRTRKFREKFYGDLMLYDTGEYLRPATAAEQRDSTMAAGGRDGSGVISVDGRLCYVND